MRFFKMFSSENKKAEIEDRFYQFLRMFRSITENLELRNMGRSRSKILTLKGEIQPLDNSTDVFMMIIFTFYGLRDRTSAMDILRMADSIHNDIVFTGSGVDVHVILDRIEDACEMVIKLMEAELEITSSDVSLEPMELLIDFKVQIETIKYELESRQV